MKVSKYRFVKSVSAILVGLCVCGIVFCTTACKGSSSSYSSDGYSDTYKKDASYRNDVNKIANDYGTSNKKVDQEINKIADYLNKK